MLDLRAVPSRHENIIPYITTAYAFTFAPLTQKTFTLNGINFKPDTTLTVPGFDGTVDNVNSISPTELEFTITSGPAETLYDLVLTNRVNNTEWTSNGEDLIRVMTSDWLDLRAGGTSFPGSDIRYRAGMSMFRDADGMWFEGFNPWSSWVKFECAAWTRGQLKTVEWIFTPGQYAMMIGIGSTATDEGSTAQYRQAEMVAYLTNPTSFARLYGNTGTVGVMAYDGSSATLSGPCFKVKFTNDGTVGPCVFTLYGLPSTGMGDWDDVSTVFKTFSPAGTLNPDEPNLMPFIIPRDGGAQRYLALRIT